MRFNDTSNKDVSLYHDALSLLGIPEADTSRFAIATFTRYVNAWYRRVVYRIWRTNSMWKFDDTNYTDLPIATTDLVAAQSGYALPTYAIDVLGVEVMNASGNYKKLAEINKQNIDVALDEYYKTDAMPVEFYREGESIFLKPAPAVGSVTLTDGLLIHLDRDIDAFTTSDTTQAPGFNTMFHRVLSLGSAYDYARSKNMADKINSIKPDLDLLLAEMEDYYTKRSRANKPKMIIKGQSNI